MKTHYDVLGVSRDADHETVKAAYRRAMKAAHPDVHDGSEAAEQHSQQIIAAYAVLRDPGQRSWYDHNLQNQRRRLRLLVMIGVMSAWLVSASTLFVLNFLLSSEGKTPLALTTGSGAYKAAGTKEPAAEPAQKAAAEKPATTAALPNENSEASTAEAGPATPANAAAEPAPQTAPTDQRDRAPADSEPAIPNPPAQLTAAEQPPAAPAADSPDPGNASANDSIPLIGNDAEAYLHRAALWVEKGQLDRALADYDEAIRLDDSNIAAFHGRALLRMRRGEVESALADLDHAIRLSFSDPKIYRDRGSIWLEKTSYDRAIADFNRAIQLDPRFADAYFLRGVALRRKGDFTHAIADLNEALRLDSSIGGAEPNRDMARTGQRDAIEKDPKPDEETSKPPLSSSRPVSKEEEKQVLAEGEAQLRSGNIVFARVLFENLASHGSAEGAFAVAQTYDPTVLKQIGAVGVQGDVEKAKFWYGKAAELGKGPVTDILGAVKQEGQ
ncbi:MAG: tetratricopeptide repeat protein [Rhodomicrobiaceae bacterium]